MGPGSVTHGGWKRATPGLSHLFCFAQVLDHLFNEILGFAIRVGAAANWVLLIQGEIGRSAVYRGRTAENYVLHAMCFHCLWWRREGRLSSREGRLRAFEKTTSRKHIPRLWLPSGNSRAVLNHCSFFPGQKFYLPNFAHRLALARPIF